MLSVLTNRGRKAPRHYQLIYRSALPQHFLHSLLCYHNDMESQVHSNIWSKEAHQGLSDPFFTSRKQEGCYSNSYCAAFHLFL